MVTFANSGENQINAAECGILAGSAQLAKVELIFR